MSAKGTVQKTTLIYCLSSFYNTAHVHNCTHVAMVTWEERMTCHVRLYDVHQVLLLEMCNTTVSEAVTCILCVCASVPPSHPGSGPGWGVWSARRSAWLRSVGAEEGSPWSDRGTDHPEAREDVHVTCSRLKSDKPAPSFSRHSVLNMGHQIIKQWIRSKYQKHSSYLNTCINITSLSVYSKVCGLEFTRSTDMLNYLASKHKVSTHCTFALINIT